jgi:membrane-bound ClpP family serine protease
MLPATPLGGPPRWGRLLCGILLGGLGLLASCGAAWAQDPPAVDGLFISVPNPIRDEAVQQIRLKVRDALERQKRPITVVVFDFNPDGQPAGSSNFGSCSDLADYIRSLQLGAAHGQRIKAVAFVRGSVTKHTVLPVLACGQVVMSLEPDAEGRPRARIGNVTQGLDEPLTKTARAAYEFQADQYPSPDLILRMLDPQLPLRRVEAGKGTFYLSPARIEQWSAEKRSFTVKSEVPRGLELGNALFDAPMAREVGLATAFYDSRAALADALKLSRQSLSEDWLVGKQPVVWRIDVTGPLDKGRVDSLRRRINSAVGRGANFLVLYLDSEGGETTHVAALANDLRQLKDKTGGYNIKKIAYVPQGRSLGAACFLAVACDEIVMGTGSALADFNYLSGEKGEALRVRRDMLLPLVREQGYPPALFEAALTRNLALVRARGPGGELRLVTEPQFKQDQEAKAPHWDSLGRIAPGPDESFLRITADLAKEWRVAQATGIDSAEALYTYYGLDPDRDSIRVSRDDLLDRVAEFFREPLVNFLLIMLGIVGLILELKLPGTTFPGAIAAICFVLFFWAYSFVGEFTLLAVLLFLLGLILIGVEIFLVPGLGFSGVAGVVLVITSLALVTLERWPETSQDWMNLGSTVSLLAMSLAAAIVSAFVLAWFLPNIPYFNRLVLKPPADLEEEGHPDLSATSYVPASLLGAIGVAVTTLRPAGKAQFGEEFLDVVAEGDYVNPGSRVQVIEIEGNRIVVKEV